MGFQFKGGWPRAEFIAELHEGRPLPLGAAERFHN